MMLLLLAGPVLIHGARALPEKLCEELPLRIPEQLDAVSGKADSKFGAETQLEPPSTVDNYAGPLDCGELGVVDRCRPSLL